jgi:tetratricopeptide (TPR) repeat protein
MIRKCTFVFATALWASIVNAQYRTVQYPNIVQSSHPELTIERISFFIDSTVVDLSIVNRLPEGGWFCTDNNTYIEDAHNLGRFKLIRAIGIPSCPDVYRFKRVDEELKFSIVFPGLPGNPQLLNLIEACDKACFSFRGIILDERLNRDISLFDKGVKCYADDKLEDAIEIFSRIVEDIPANPTHVYGYSFYNLIRIYFQKGDKKTAQLWFEQLEKSGLPNKQYFIDALKDEGINF